MIWHLLKIQQGWKQESPVAHMPSDYTESHCFPVLDKLSTGVPMVIVCKCQTLVHCW